MSEDAAAASRRIRRERTCLWSAGEKMRGPIKRLLIELVRRAAVTRSGQVTRMRTAVVRTRTWKLVARYRHPTWSRMFRHRESRRAYPEASPRVHGAASSALPFLQPQKLRAYLSLRTLPLKATPHDTAWADLYVG